MPLDYKHTCPEIDRNITALKSVIESYLSDMLDDCCPTLDGKLHTCENYETETTQPDKDCHEAPKPVAVCENCRFNNPKNYHDLMWCRDCQQ
ncbi:MAG: hypothetical protein SNJ71_08835, partial [Bacteroidales bacterium]